MIALRLGDGWILTDSGVLVLRFANLYETENVSEKGNPEEAAGGGRDWRDWCALLFGVADEDVDDGLAGRLWKGADAGSALRRGCSCRQGMLGLTTAGYRAPEANYRALSAKIRNRHNHCGRPLNRYLGTKVQWNNP